MRFIRRIFTSITLFLTASTLQMFCMAAFPQEDIVKRYIPNAELVGEARMKYFLWNVYDARLFAPKGTWKPEKPFALELRYLRELEGKEIAKRSIAEIRNQGFTNEKQLAAWLDNISQVFPNVDKDSTILGVASAQGNSRFYHNGEFIGAVEDSKFTVWFFNIWLGEKTSEPKLRKKLLNL